MLRMSMTRDRNSKQILVHGDRFIPTRSLMNFDFAHTMLSTERQTKFSSLNQTFKSEMNSKGAYKKMLEETLMMNSEGQPQKILVFKSVLKNNSQHQNELLDDHQDNFSRIRRKIPNKPEVSVHAPKMLNNYYSTIMDWGKGNIMAIALGHSVYLWNTNTRKVTCLSTSKSNDYPVSVAWLAGESLLSIGFASSKIELWDTQTLQQVRIFEGHIRPVICLCWNDRILTSGGFDRTIINHDVRSSKISTFRGHTGIVCGLKWSLTGNLLASGGDDNTVFVLQKSTMGSGKYLHKLEEHSGGVKALTWSPYQYNTLVSGGGTADKCIKIWNVQSGKCTKSIQTDGQVCALEWNRHQNEILSAHGFGSNRLSLWSYPSMSKIKDLRNLDSRILHLCQNPEGTKVAAAEANMIHLYKLFQPSKPSIKDGGCLLSLARTHIR